MIDDNYIFHIEHPQGCFTDAIQAVWSASVPSSAGDSVKRWLQPDAGSGILFNLANSIFVDNKEYAPGAYLLPVCKQAYSVALPPGAELAGVRFNPAFGFGFMGERYSKPTPALQTGVSAPVQEIYHRLCQTLETTMRIDRLFQWLDQVIKDAVVPDSLHQALHGMRDSKTLQELNSLSPISQRQLERQFQKWLGMTAKEVERVLRVQQALKWLKQNPKTELVDLAYTFGFTDQAHMTREFKQIAKITPKQFGKVIACRQP